MQAKLKKDLATIQEVVAEHGLFKVHYTNLGINNEQFITVSHKDLDTAVCHVMKLLENDFQIERLAHSETSDYDIMSALIHELIWYKPDAVVRTLENDLQDSGIFCYLSFIIDGTELELRDTLYKKYFVL